MRFFFFILVLFLGPTQTLYASSRGDVKILEATENIQYLSQKITKDYFFFYRNPKDLFLQKQLNQNLKKIQYSIDEIKGISNTQNNNNNNLLEYLSYKAKKIKEIINQKKNLSNAIHVLDYTEVILEGAQSIAKKHTYEFSEDEKMLMTSKEIQYLLERSVKYYIAMQIGLNSSSSLEKLEYAIIDIDKHLTNIESYHYPYIFKLKLNKVKGAWQTNRDFLTKANETSIPYLLLNSTQYIENLLQEIEEYHKKNL